MKTLKDHTILYDAECPVCTLYAKKLESSGALAIGSGAAYQTLQAAACPMVDRQRAANEIAMIHTRTGEVTYGIDSLFKLMANTWPNLKGLFNFKPFLWLMARVYRFFSYNRRVIVPAGNVNAFAIQPAFKIKYRLTYLFFTWLMASCILTGYAHLLSDIMPVGGTYREYFICGGQIVFQGLIVSFYARHKKWDYLGNMMTISAGGALLLLPALVVNLFITLPALVYTLYFLGVAALMFFEHIRRTKLLALGWVLTLTWVLYRIGILLYILKFE
ncbi:DUF393 domain-containing protein [Mucilaginibacter hurinus]|uniref:DUF393 domain-containing protein n=1 Tax=Mucilaginibacter hurinus TaxID=2201324 RepID=A0A367GQG5_9SPHI|nr:DCC1-like thiol-disulfide oxidoreductase family protein [Mucilaginibacter hurinus]RCH55510.1 DUF393 domain-containing protein [Mucilaginibacter hurinus]